MTKGLDPKRIKDMSMMAEQPPSETGITNIFSKDLMSDNLSVDQGEQYDYGNLDGTDSFPREGGSDTYTGIPGDGIVPG